MASPPGGAAGAAPSWESSAEDFGQKVDLTVRIREILRNYPEGLSILKELIQNADDAGARTVRFVAAEARPRRRIDGRGSAGVEAEGLSDALSGPSLLAYNSAQFTETDFRSIQRIGDSLKKAGKTKTGRFGVGVNSTYHLTDVPMFVSGSKVVLFDPQARYVPGINPANPGKMIDCSKPSGRALVSSLPAVFDPLRAFGCQLDGAEFAGTTFRLALRSEEAAETSRLSRRSHTLTDVRNLLHEMAGAAPAMLLFLKNVENIEVYDWAAASEAPVMVHRTGVENATTRLRRERSYMLEAPPFVPGRPARAPVAVDYLLEMRSEGIGTVAEGGSAHVSEKWMVCNQLGGGRASAMATDKAAEHMRLVPWAGVAARLSPAPTPCVEYEGGDGSVEIDVEGVEMDGAEDATGRTTDTSGASGGAAYCFLPLPVSTRLPVHVNAYFELSSNRRDVWWSADDMSGDGRRRAVWNASLLADVAGPCYCRLLEGAIRAWGRDGDGAAAEENYEALFPTETDRLAGPWKLLAHRFYAGIRDLSVLRSQSSPSESSSGLDLTGRWIAPSASVLLAEDEGDSEVLVEVLKAERLPLVTFKMPGLRRCLVERGACQITATPQYVRNHFRARGVKLGGAFELVEKRQRFAEYLIRFCSSDLACSKYADELAGCQFIPLANGDLGTLKVVPHVESEVLSQLGSMGFTRLAFFGALLEASGNVDAAIEALFARKYDSQKGLLPAPREDNHSTQEIYLLCSGDGARLLSGRANGSFVDLDGLKDPVARKVLEQMGQSPPSLNLMELLPESLVDAVEMAIPREWCSSGSATWFQGTVDDNKAIGRKKEDDVASQPSKEWFSFLWKYIFTSDEPARCLDAVAAAGHCIVPTSQGITCALSLDSAVIDPSGLESTLVEGLQRLGVRILVPGVLPRNIVAPEELWSYLHRPDRDGVVCALYSAIRRWASENKNVDGKSSPFDTVPDVERKRLYDFVRNGVNGTLSKSSKKLLLNFPIFCSHLDECVVGTQYVAPIRSGTWYAMEGVVSPDPIDQAIMSSEFLAYDGVHELEFLASVMKIKRLTRSQFYRRFVLPQIGDLDEGMRASVTERVLIDLSAFCASDPTFRDALVATKFVPSAITRTLRSPAELYNPEISELRTLMSEDSFPHEQLLSRNLLLSLKDLGLQSHLSWGVILDCAQSIEQDGIQTDEEEKRKMAGVRGKQLLAFLDSNVAEYFPDLVPKEVSKSSSFLRRVNAALFEDAEKKKRDEVMQRERVNRLLAIKWMPVRTAPLHPLLPWPSDPAPVSSPLQTCTKENVWLVSYSRRLVEGDVRSNELKKLFGWFNPVSVKEVAVQLKSLAAKFESICEKIECQGERSGSSTATAVNTLRQTVTSEVPRIYNILNGATSEYDCSKIKSTLYGCSWLWMGDKFVSADHVAFSSPINALPYLYTVPPDLACFRNLLSIFGIRKRFTASDYALVLQRMSDESSKRTNGTFSSTEVEMAVSLVQGLSDDVTKVRGMEIYAPTENGKILAASKMTYDDAPWLSKDMPSKKDIIFIHPKISAAVASRIGAISLRQSLVKDNAVMITFGESTVQGAEAFGQSESLTRRLKNIIEMYPEGSQQLSELVQNADDARASIVKFVVSYRHHGTSSLLGQKLAPWQGPALLCYNDAKFSAQDFQNIASIGNASKLQRLSTTGRFGLGFNSTFHWTDVPSIVSGDHLVFFDPHARYVPGATASNRGIKIRFANNASLKEQFPDQMKPYCLFGCNMVESFDGTLFRFPFRTDVTAANSEISRNQCGKSIDELLRDFKNILPKFLLFLRHVKRIEVYVEGQDESESLRLLYFAHVAERKNMSGMDNHRQHAASSPSNTWTAVSDFVSGLPKNPLSRDDFYSRLIQTPEDQLPRTRHLVTVQFVDCSKHLGGTSVDKVRTIESSDVTECAVEISERHVPSEGEDGDDVVTDDYLVFTSLGGGDCLRMACDPKHRDMKFLPWGGVAAQIKSNGENARLLHGSAFCFLPLPAETGLPVHVNGYFELSANRRDIWHGQDMQGAGKYRSLWNRALLADVIAPLYGDLLLAASRILGPGTAYDQLWPVTTNGEVWKIVHDAVYGVAQDVPLFHTMLHGGSWCSPNSCCVLDVSEKPEASKRLLGLLLQEGIQCVSLPSQIIKSLKSTSCQTVEVTQEMVRAWFKKATQHPSLNTQTEALFILKYCFEDLVGSGNFKELSGLPLLPLCSGRLGEIRYDGHPDYFVCSKKELELLSRASEKIVDVWTPDETVNNLMKSAAFLEGSNVARLDLQSFVHLLSYCYPPEWCELLEVRWNPNPTQHPTSSSAISKAFVQDFWNYVVEGSVLQGCGLEPFIDTWQILPSHVGDGERTLLKLASNLALLSLMHPDTGFELDDGVGAVLRNIGVRTLDTSVFSEKNRRAVVTMLKNFVHMPSVLGLTKALANSFPTDADERDIVKRLGLRFKGVADDGKDKLRAFLCNNMEDDTKMEKNDIALLRALPIYKVYDNGGSREATNAFAYSNLATEKFLPPVGADPFLLDHNFIHCSEGDSSFIEALGVQRMTMPEFYEQYVCRRGSESGMDSALEDSVLKLLRDTPQIAEEHGGAQWMERVSGIAFLPNRSGTLHCVSDLYDPLESSLAGLLDDSMLPSEKFCAPSSLSSLRLFGLRSSLDAEAVIEIARSIEKSGGSLLLQGDIEYRVTEVTTRARALLNFLDRDETVRSLFECRGEAADKEQNVEGTSHPGLQPSFDNTFTTMLNEIAWLPIERSSITDSDAPGPPRKERQGLSKAGIAPPRATRPKQDEWICSGSMEILSTNVRSELLCRCFGWNRPVPIIVVASQVLELSCMHASIDAPSRGRAFHQTLATVIPRCYDMLNNHLESADEDERDRFAMLFHERPWLWVGDRFVSTSQVAFNAPDNARPFLFTVPNELLCFDKLLKACGVREKFSPNDFVTLLSSLKRQVGERTPTQKEIDLASFAARHLSQLPADELAAVEKKDIFLFSKDGSMHRATDMMYDDAPWLSAIVTQKAKSRFCFVHNNISIETAQTLGARSLRDVLSARHGGMVKIPCPRSDALHQYLSKREDGGDCGLRAVRDLLEIAEMNSVKQVSISVDRRSHNSVSLLHPCLEAAQGPAIAVCFHDVALEVDDIIKLSSPSKFYLSSVSGQGGCGGAGFPRFGSGLCSSFSVSDCLQILTGSSLMFFDPCGEYFIDGEKKSHVRPERSNSSESGKAPFPATTEACGIEDHRNEQQRAPSEDPGQKHKGTRAVGRNYAMSREVFHQFPDQFEPFLTLPFGVRESFLQKTDSPSRPFFRGTVIRLPLRTIDSPSSALSDHMIGDAEITELLSGLEQLHNSFLFTYHLQSICVGEWRPSDPKQSPILNARVSSSPLARRTHLDDLNNNKDWKKSSSKFTKLFKSSYSAERSSYTMQISHRHGQDSSDTVDSYIIQTILAPPRLREMACTEALKPLRLLPAVSLAALVHSTKGGESLNSDFECAKNSMFVGLDTGIDLGLPFALNAPLFLHELSGDVLLGKDDDKDLRKMFPGVRNVTVSGASGDEVKTLALHIWNKQAITSALTCLIPSMLRELCDHICFVYSRDPRLLYNYWPYFQRIKERFQALLPDSVYQSLANTALYLTDKGGFKNVSDGYFVHADYPYEATDFFQEKVNLFRAPKAVAEDLCRAGVGTRQITPKLVRRIMKRGKHMQLLSHRPTEALIMLKYCLSDMQEIEDLENGSPKMIEWRNELVGLCLVPLADGSVGSIGRPMIVADKEQQQMLPSLKGKFVCHTAIQEFDGFDKPGLLSLLGLTQFGPKILASQISSVLPSSWQGKDFVPFRPEDGEPLEGPSRLWIYQFWKQVPIWDQEAVQMFRRWPLIPTTSGELASCGNAKYILFFCLAGCDSALLDSLVAEHTAFVEAAEARAKREVLRNAAEARARSSEQMKKDDAFWTMGSPDVGGERDDQDSNSIEEENAALDDAADEVTALVEGQDSAANQEPANRRSEQPDAVPIAPDSISTGDEVLSHEASSPSVEALFRLLKGIRCPLLEGAYFSNDHLIQILPRDRLSLTRSVLSTLKQSMDFWKTSDDSGDDSRLCWDSLDCEECDELIALLTESRGSRLTLMTSDLNHLKLLPLFETISGRRTALTDGHDHFTLESSISPDRLHYLPESLRCKLLAGKTELQDLYADMGIRELDEATLLQKFVLPEFHSLPLAQKENVCQTILEKWPGLGSSDDFTECLKVTPFVKRLSGGGEVVFVQPSQLLDPQNELIAFIFDSDQSKFPAEEFSSDEWLEILRKVGLKHVVDKEAFLECAWQVEAEQSVAKAMKLLAFYQDNIGNFFDSSQDFGRKLASIKCVPGEVFHGDVSSPVSLYRFCDVAASRDRHIVFRSLPVLPDSVCPPQVMFSTLGIVSPPSISTVLKHVRSLTENNDVLEHWCYSYGTVEEVFSHIFSFLQENYDRISPRVQEGLQERPLVPVGSSLVKPSRLFFRLKRDLAPFFYEVPRAFGAYDQLLRSIGVRDAPKGDDYGLSLAELQREVGNTSLNANELKSVIELVSLVVDESHSVGTLSRSKLYVPDYEGKLVSSDLVFQNDCPWLVNRLNLGLLHLVHPKLGEKLCEQLSIGLLSKSIEEHLEEGFIPAIIDTNDFSLARVQQNINSDHFLGTISELLDDPHGDRIGAIKNIKIVPVKNLRTSFILSTRVGGVNVTHDPTGSYCIVDKERVLLAELPAGLSRELAVAVGVCNYLSIDRKHVAGLAAMLASDQSSIELVGQTMGLFGANEQGELRRGEPGYPLVSTDLKLVELKPLKVFNKGEIVAVQRDEGPLIYAVVVECGAGSSLSRIRVCVGKNIVRTMLSSEVYSIQSSRNETASRKDAMQPQPTQMNLLLEPKGAAARESDEDGSENLEETLVNDDNGVSARDDSSAMLTVSRNDILGAVQDLLQSAGMSLDDDVKDAMDSNLTLQDKISEKDERIEAMVCEGKTLSEGLSKGLDAFLCPITREIMTDPVICADGHSYERHAIEMWLRTSSRSPKTNQHLSSRVLIPNHAMRNAIDSMTENINDIRKFTDKF